MIHVCGPRDKVTCEVINTTSWSANWSRELSPFFLGPVDLYGEYKAENVENAWQYSKVYPEHTESGSGNPTKRYFEWAVTGWGRKYADRYPMGKGRKPLYSFWDGKRLGYVEARKLIYAPLYAEAVEDSQAFKKLQTLYKKRGELWLWDFDGYDHRKLGMTYRQVLNCETRKMGHAFVLAMLLENKRRWEK